MRGSDFVINKPVRLHALNAITQSPAELLASSSTVGQSLGSRIAPSRLYPRLHRLSQLELIKKLRRWGFRPICEFATKHGAQLQVCPISCHYKEPLTNNHRKYEPSVSFGTVCTASSNCVCAPESSSKTASARSTGAGKAYVGANEEVICWDVKKGEELSRWNDKDNRSAVTCISQCAVQPDLMAVGHADGAIRIWDALSGQVVVSFNGHPSAVMHLQFDTEGARLASGSRDTDIIVWNLLS